MAIAGIEAIDDGEPAALVARHHAGRETGREQNERKFPALADRDRHAPRRPSRSPPPPAAAHRRRRRRHGVERRRQGQRATGRGPDRAGRAVGRTGFAASKGAAVPLHAGGGTTGALQAAGGECVACALGRRVITGGGRRHRRQHRHLQPDRCDTVACVALQGSGCAGRALGQRDARAAGTPLRDHNAAPANVSTEQP